MGQSKMTGIDQYNEPKRAQVLNGHIEYSCDDHLREIALLEERGVMEGAIQTMVKVFLKSTKGKESLGKKEFQDLVKDQLSNILSVRKSSLSVSEMAQDSKEAVNNMGQGLDADQDGKVGFEEYMKLVGYLAVSLSEQRGLAKEEPPQNAAVEQEAQSTPDKEEEKPEAKEEAKPEVSEEPKADATAEVKVEANAEPKVEVKVAEETKPEVPKVEENPPAAATAAEVTAAVEEAASAVEAVVKEEKVEITDKVEEAAEKVAAVVEEVEKKTEEATS
ncbi:S-100 protein alpha chain [Collichthys lucidus]|uniref:S-100 protein alpha chain n=1 Tax=Collichthys lucidus TaxID=240159 RepID=A0A4U5VJE3_COLLU|nr:S-100 protein alpha chain [Collichthys lucidus]